MEENSFFSSPCGNTIKDLKLKFTTTNTTRWAIFTISLILIAFLFFREALAHLITAVIHREGSSHGVFIPFITGYFIWQKKDDLKKIQKDYDLLGIPFLIMGGILAFIGAAIFQVQVLAFYLITISLLILISGRTYFLKILFPILFLLTMIPIPEAFYERMAILIRDITLSGAVWIAYHLGITFFQDGIMIQLPNALLQVNLGCSGIRYLVSYFVFGLAYAYMFKEKPLSRLLIVASTILISITASILRLTIIFLLTYYISPKMAEYWPHVFISWSVFFIVMIVAIYLDQFFSTPSSAKQSDSREVTKTQAC